MKQIFIIVVLLCFMPAVGMQETYEYPGTMHACVNRNGGDVRLIREQQTCRSYEIRTAWPGVGNTAKLWLYANGVRIGLFVGVKPFLGYAQGYTHVYIPEANSLVSNAAEMARMKLPGKDTIKRYINTLTHHKMVEETGTFCNTCDIKHKQFQYVGPIGEKKGKCIMDFLGVDK